MLTWWILQLRVGETSAMLIAIKVNNMNKGTVKWFDSKKGFGFIIPDDESNDIFVHHSGITGDDDTFKTLHDGDEVEYEVGEGEKGPNAINVVVTKAAPRPQRRRRNDYD